MDAILIEQALFAIQGASSPRLLARSADFHDVWLGPAEELCAGFGQRPEGIACPRAVFAQPLGKQHVAVVQVADQGVDERDRPTTLCFRVLVISRRQYSDRLGDPFAFADRFPPPWHARGDLQALTWSADAPVGRSVAEIQTILQRPDCAALLGGAQALVDGARLAFERALPDTDLIRSLWSLLPSSTRGNLWPASFAFGNGLGFDALVVPRARGEAFAGYLTEEQAADYPEGRYELSLQIAAEAGDQEELDVLFARRSRAQTWRLGILLLIVALVLALAMKVLNPVPPARPRPKAPATARQHPQQGTSARSLSEHRPASGNRDDRHPHQNRLDRPAGPTEFAA